MSQNESVNFFMRVVNERHKDLITNIDKLYISLVSENKKEKVTANEVALGSLNTLSSFLSESDTPHWLTDLKGRLNWYVTNHSKRNDSNKVLIDKLIELNQQIHNHKWTLDQEVTNDSYNFDEIYERFKIASKLPELFDILIDTLEKMIASGEVDSIKTVTGLQQLLALLKQNKSGSYFSVMASWEFLGGFIKNTMWATLDSIPVIKQMKKGFEKTVEDMDRELDEVHKSIAEEMRAKYNTTVNSLTYKRQSENLLENKKETA